jgi:hypothetical protein
MYFPKWLTLSGLLVLFTLPSAARSSESQQIPSGNYWWKPTGSILVVKGDRYRYEYDDGNPTKWQPITQLKPITKGIILDNNQTYWCLSTLPSSKVGSSCTPDGFQ